MCAVARLLVFGNDLSSHIEDSRVVEQYHTSVGTGFDVNTASVAIFVVVTAEIVSYSVSFQAQLISNALHAAVGQLIFNFTQLVECDCLCHSSTVLEVSKYLIFFNVPNLRILFDISKYFLDYFTTVFHFVIESIKMSAKIATIAMLASNVMFSILVCLQLNEILLYGVWLRSTDMFFFVEMLISRSML